jgi:hypothetical protein
MSGSLAWSLRILGAFSNARAQTAQRRVDIWSGPVFGGSGITLSAISAPLQWRNGSIPMLKV